MYFVQLKHYYGNEPWLRRGRGVSIFLGIIMNKLPYESTLIWTTMILMISGIVNQVPFSPWQAQTRYRGVQVMQPLIQHRYCRMQIQWTDDPINTHIHSSFYYQRTCKYD